MFRNSPKPFIERLEMAVRASPLNRKGSAEEVADFIVYLLGSESSYITGQVLHVDGGILA
jgi:NAD(P)-dependent dehydrogenase (short-subunit alcohol dehydrogenase family)